MYAGAVRRLWGYRCIQQRHKAPRPLLEASPRAGAALGHVCPPPDRGHFQAPWTFFGVFNNDDDRHCFNDVSK